MTPIESIIYGILKYIQLDNSDMHTLIGFADNLIKTNTRCEIHKIYSVVIDDVVSASQDEDVDITNSQICVYLSKFINIIDFSNKSNNDIDIQTIIDVNSDIDSMIDYRHAFSKRNSDKEYVESLLDLICANQLDFRSILRNTISSSYAYRAYIS
jgi:hypothetical protein